jgi:hypothetical protein
VQNGTPLYALRETGGRSGVEMVRCYAHLAADHPGGLLGQDVYQSSAIIRSVVKGMFVKRVAVARSTRDRLRSIVLRLLADLISAVMFTTKSRASLEAENLVLRREVALHKERRVKPRRIDAATRISLTLLSRMCAWCAMSSSAIAPWAAIEAQRAHTQLAGKEIFGNPATGTPWADIQSQWRIWQRCLKRLGLRYREPYQTRHTFATLALMEGANPSYIARQLGNTSANMLFRVYSKWIDGADKSRERDKLNHAFDHEFVHDLATELIREAKQFAQSNTYLAEREGFEPATLRGYTMSVRG